MVSVPRATELAATDWASAADEANEAEVALAAVPPDPEITPEPAKIAA